MVLLPLFHEADHADHQDESQHAAGGQNHARPHDGRDTYVALLMAFLDVPAGFEYSNLSLSMFRFQHLDKTRIIYRHERTLAQPQEKENNSQIPPIAMGQITYMAASSRWKLFKPAPVPG